MAPFGISRQRAVAGDKEELLEVVAVRSDDPSFTTPAQSGSKQEPILPEIVVPDDEADHDHDQKDPTWLVTIMYGAGILLNELCGSMWFSYVLYALELQGVSTSGAAAVLLAGQIADAVAIPIAGQLSDITNHRLGKRRPWLAGGAVVLSLSFIALFSPAPGDSASVTIAWYILWAVTANFGLAAVQVAHYALGTELSPKQSIQVRLNSVRFGFSVAARLIVFAIAGIAFETIDGMTFTHFQGVAYVIVGIGVVAVGLCVAFVKEPEFLTATTPGRKMAMNEPGKDGAPVPVSYWFSVRLFYEVAVIFAVSRTVDAVIQSSMPFYVERSLQMEKSAVAMGPLALQLASLFGAPTSCLGKAIRTALI